jgi:hypothetical protein
MLSLAVELKGRLGSIAAAWERERALGWCSRINHPWFRHRRDVRRQLLHRNEFSKTIFAYKSVKDRS